VRPASWVSHGPLGIVLALLVGCASVLDIPELRAPPAGSADAGSDSACPSTPVATLTNTPRGVHTALDDTDVYFTRADPPRDSVILRCAKCGCAEPTELTTLGQPGGIAVDDRYVFFTNSQVAGSLDRIDKSDPTKHQRLDGQESPIGVAVDATHVYWTVLGGGPMDVATAGVYRAKKDDLSEVTRLAKSDSLPNNIVPYAIAVDDTHVYYTMAPDLDDTNPDVPCSGKGGSVRRLDKAGGLQTPTLMATGQPCPLGLALSDDTIYWVNLGAGATLTGSLWRTSKGGGTPAQLTTNLGRPTSLAFHAGRLSWNAPGNQRVETCTVPACADVATLAPSQLNPSGMTADSSGIYWLVLGTAAQNFTDGALRRASQP
jgi:hypothetical protein